VGRHENPNCPRQLLILLPQIWPSFPACPCPPTFASNPLLRKNQKTKILNTKRTKILNKSNLWTRNLPVKNDEITAHRNLTAHNVGAAGGSTHHQPQNPNISTPPSTLPIYEIFIISEHLKARKEQCRADYPAFDCVSFNPIDPFVCNSPNTVQSLPWWSSMVGHPFFLTRRIA
jgi:hypothetical protein